MDRNSKEITLAKLNSRNIITEHVSCKYLKGHSSQTQTLKVFKIKGHNILFNLIKKP